MQSDFRAIGVFKADVHLAALECQRPRLRLAVPQNPAFDLKRMGVYPAPLRGIDPVKRRGTFAENSPAAAMVNFTPMFVISKIVLANSYQLQLPSAVAWYRP